MERGLEQMRERALGKVQVTSKRNRKTLGEAQKQP